MLDTNILISAFIFDSNPIKKVFEIASRKENDLLIPRYVINEMFDVVERKWPNRLQDLSYYLALLDYVDVPEDETTIFTNALDVPSIRDINDLPVLQAAISSRADILVTGDKDFADIKVDALEILHPIDFAEQYS